MSTHIIIVLGVLSVVSVVGSIVRLRHATQDTIERLRASRTPPKARRETNHAV